MRMIVGPLERLKEGRPGSHQPVVLLPPDLDLAITVQQRVAILVAQYAGVHVESVGFLGVYHASL